MDDSIPEQSRRVPAPTKRSGAYCLDPVFETENDLNNFLSDYHGETVYCKETVEPDKGRNSVNVMIKRVCTCEVCTDLSYGQLDHLCCQQMSHKWMDKLSDYETSVKCVAECEAFNGSCNPYAIRNLLLSMWDKSNIAMEDPPQNSKLRKAGYRAAHLFLDGKSRVRRPLPSCIMTVIRQKFPENDDVYMGFHFK